MEGKFMDSFCWFDVEPEGSAQQMYNNIADWAGRARGQNPCAFDSLTEWILNDAEWTDDKLMRNRDILLGGVFEGFLRQNALLRGCLASPGLSVYVNKAVFPALDRFDAALLGRAGDTDLNGVADAVFADFSAMRGRDIREKFAGGITGAAGTDSVEIFGYINWLKDLDAGVQWTLFMPGMVEGQQRGFRVESFEYISLPAIRFIGRDIDELKNFDDRRAMFAVLDDMRGYKSGFDFDLLLGHHCGRGVDTERWHGCFGRFMKADTPVPEGFMHIDFIPGNDGEAGAPYMSRFAYAVFSGDMEALHSSEGFDVDAMYDVTRNIILGQGVNIPYPRKYWTAEVFPDGSDSTSYAYIFSADTGR